MRKLGDYIREKDPSVVFLAKTWIDDAMLDQVLHNFDFINKWLVSSGNRGDGLVCCGRKIFESQWKTR